MTTLLHGLPGFFDTSLAAISSLEWRELLAGLAVVITLAGTYLCWHSHRHRMSIEERAKDGKLTEDQARRKIWFMGWFAPTVAIGGCVLMALAFLS